MNKSTIEDGQQVSPSIVNASVVRSLVELPNRFFYYVAKQFLKSAYSEEVSYSFFSFKIERRNFKKTGAIKVKCSNGGASMNILVRDNGIVRTGNYSKHRKVNDKYILDEALKNLDKIPEYYSVKFQHNIDCFQRCVDDVELAKSRVIKYWNSVHPSSPIAEPINWIIQKV